MNKYDYVKVFNDLPIDLCERVIMHSAVSKWSRHSWSSYKQNHEQVNSHQDGDCDVCHISLEDLYEETENIVFKTLKERYESECGHTGVGRWSNIRLNRYRAGQGMKGHIDNIHSIFDGKRKGVPIISVVGIIDDDFEGGEFIFNNEYEIKLKQGDILFFPSNFLYQHKVEPVTSGERFSFVTWGY